MLLKGLILIICVSVAIADRNYRPYYIKLTSWTADSILHDAKSFDTCRFGFLLNPTAKGFYFDEVNAQCQLGSITDAEFVAVHQDHGIQVFIDDNHLPTKSKHLCQELIHLIN